MDRARPLTRFEHRHRWLPHLEQPGRTYHLIFTLQRPPVVDLARPDIAAMVIAALQHFDGQRYLLYDYAVLPDHVHLVAKPLPQGDGTWRLSSITNSLKGWTARQINLRLGHRGQVWQTETYDRLLRDDAEYDKVAQYILDNARARGLVDDPLDWPWWGRGSGRW